MSFVAAAVIGGAALGGFAGSQADHSNTSYSSGLILSPATALERQGQNGLSGAYSDLQSFVGAGPGQQDVTNGTNASRDLASLLQAYQNGGANPNASDFQTANNLASQLFQGQRTALNQNFADQLRDANRQAALMGRDMNDPVLRAKLAQEQTRQASLLDANQGSWAAQFAMNQPMQRLDFANQRAGVLGGLATQAMANRQALASMGESIMNDERNFRLATATRFGSQDTTSGGGMKGLIQGALAGGGAGASMASGLGAGGAGAGAGGAGGFSAASPAMANASPQAISSMNYWNSPNPYGAAGPGLSAQPAAQPAFSGSYGSQFGAQTGAPRSFSLGSYQY